MDRRRFVAWIAGALAMLSAPAFGQTGGGMRRLAALSPGSASSGILWPDFFQELQNLGWAEGRNIAIDRVYADGENDRLPALAARIAASAPDVIVTVTTPAVIALQQATSTIPIVAAAVADPVATGVVARMNRPGSNVTGMSSFASELNSKRLQLLKELAPGIKHVAVLGNPAGVATAAALKEIRAAAEVLAVKLTVVEIKSAEGLGAALARIAGLRADALFVPNEQLLLVLREKLAGFALANKLPSSFGYPQAAESGGLFVYAPSYAELLQRAARYVDKILRGEKPGNLPFEQPGKFDLIINMKTAKALGLRIPQSILLRADRVIE